ncbi:MAG: DUF4157 domain-containing protein, partial [Bacteroidota bacterium]
MKNRSSRSRRRSKSAHRDHRVEQKDNFFDLAPQAPSHFFGPSTIQPQLQLGEANDHYEQEANAMAEKAVSTPAATPQVQRKCADCEKKEKLQRKMSPGPTPTQQPPLPDRDLEQNLSQSRGSGQGLTKNTRQNMEPVFNADFSQVKVHTDPSAVQMNQQLAARAFTHGQDIYFNQGEYQPNTHDGQKLLAHELTHVVQQNGNGQSAAASAPNVQKACGPTAIGEPTDCTFSNTAVAGPRYLFDVNCDTFKGGFADMLRAEARRASNNDVIEIHGFASIEGGNDFNRHLSCARAIKAKGIVESELAANGISATVVLFNHGGVSGNAETNRSVAVRRISPEIPTPEPEEPPKDHFRIELKAWIPHRKVVDPEETVRASNILDLWIGSIPSPIDMEFESFYRGDNHNNYVGSYRVLSVAEFDWDGSNISGFSQSGTYGATHRDYSYEVFIDNVWPIPNVSLYTTTGTETDTATSATNGSKLSSNSFDLGLASANPLVMTWAPDIDSDLTGTINTSGSAGPVLSLDYMTDGFPSHGIRVSKNGSILTT